MSELTLQFLGTGTSAGIPMIGCHCPVCSSDDPHDRRTRCSVVFSYDGHNVLVDTSPELRLQAVAGGIDMVDAVVLTHAHADHIMGMDDLRRFNALRDGPLDVWAEPPVHEVLRHCFGYAFNPPQTNLKVFRPNLIPRDIDGPFELFGQSWQPIRLYHGQLPILGFRVGNIAYCTDVNRIPPESMQLLQNLDVFVVDGLQWQPHSTHFSLNEAISIAKTVAARQTYFTHIAHALSHAKTNAQLPPGMALAHDGLIVTSNLSSLKKA